MNKKDISEINKIYNINEKYINIFGLNLQKIIKIYVK